MVKKVFNEIKKDKWFAVLPFVAITLFAVIMMSALQIDKADAEDDEELADLREENEELRRENWNLRDSNWLLSDALQKMDAELQELKEDAGE